MTMQRTSFQPETVHILSGIVESIWSALTPVERAYTDKSEIAMRLMEMANAGDAELDELLDYILSPG
jgi:hypothetical protein